jgi:hypothetical protein
MNTLRLIPLQKKLAAFIADNLDGSFLSHAASAEIFDHARIEAAIGELAVRLPEINKYTAEQIPLFGVNTFRLFPRNSHLAVIAGEQTASRMIFQSL